MKLYHGSRDGNLEILERKQAQAGEGLDVPAHELKKAVYLTPIYGYALAIASRPDGVTSIEESPKTIEFEKPEDFDPDREAYVYEVDIPESELIKNSDLEYIVESDYEVRPINVFKHKAIDVAQYYELVNWQQEKPETTDPQFKMR